MSPRPEDDVRSADRAGEGLQDDERKARSSATRARGPRAEQRDATSDPTPAVLAYATRIGRWQMMKAATSSRLFRLALRWIRTLKRGSLNV